MSLYDALADEGRVPTTKAAKAKVTKVIDVKVLLEVRSIIMGFES